LIQASIRHLANNREVCLLSGQLRNFESHCDFGRTEIKRSSQTPVKIGKKPNHPIHKWHSTAPQNPTSRTPRAMKFVEAGNAEANDVFPCRFPKCWDFFLFQSGCRVPLRKFGSQDIADAMKMCDVILLVSVAGPHSSLRLNRALWDRPPFYEGPFGPLRCTETAQGKG
jgi:hypothetical protein